MVQSIVWVRKSRRRSSRGTDKPLEELSEQAGDRSWRRRKKTNRRQEVEQDDGGKFGWCKELSGKVRGEIMSRGRRTSTQSMLILTAR